MNLSATTPSAGGAERKTEIILLFARLIDSFHALKKAANSECGQKFDIHGKI